MRDAENIREVERLGIDMMGFICWERSPRYVREVPAYLPNCPRVGVFVNPTLEEIQKRMEAFEFSYIQLHGSESPEFCKEVREKTGCKVIKAKSLPRPLQRRGERSKACDIEGLDTDEELQRLFPPPLEGLGEAFLLFDTKCSTMGGSGKQFNWDILSDYRGDLPFLLSGGIGPEDAERLRQFHHDKCLGFDINSHFEIEPGIKDTEKIKQFITAIREN
jgi:phosphoribosylanthranilate isomerase